MIYLGPKFPFPLNKILILFLCCTSFALSQDPLRLKEDVAQIQKKYDKLWDASRETIVFTGSSSIRLWGDLESRFPNSYIVNTGFGGSHASDLKVYSQQLISRFKPKKVFIYEGDNDISVKKRPDSIIETMKELIVDIRLQNPDIKIVLISAKPSISRWALKGRYMRLNKKMARLCEEDGSLAYADVWSPMLRDGKVIQDIFLEDGLHMNTKGYDIWYNVLKPFVETY